MSNRQPSPAVAARLTQNTSGSSAAVETRVGAVAQLLTVRRRG